MLSSVFVAILFFSLVGSLAAQKSALNLDGARVDPLSISAGKIVVLVFVRTDCPISNRYAPVIQRISTRYADKAMFWLVYPDKTESPEKIRQHAREHGYALPAFRDTQHALVKQSLARTTPEAAVFDGHGRLLYHAGLTMYTRILVGHAVRRPHMNSRMRFKQHSLANRFPIAAHKH